MTRPFHGLTKTEACFQTAKGRISAALTFLGLSDHFFGHPHFFLGKPHYLGKAQRSSGPALPNKSICPKGKGGWTICPKSQTLAQKVGCICEAVGEHSLPLTAIECDFVVDSSGFSTSRLVVRYNARAPRRGRATAFCFHHTIGPTAFGNGGVFQSNLIDTGWRGE